VETPLKNPSDLGWSETLTSETIQRTLSSFAWNLLKGIEVEGRIPFMFKGWFGEQKTEFNFWKFILFPCSINRPYRSNFV